MTFWKGDCRASLAESDSLRNWRVAGCAFRVYLYFHLLRVRLSALNMFYFPDDTDHRQRL